MNVNEDANNSVIDETKNTDMIFLNNETTF